MDMGKYLMLMELLVTMATLLMDFLMVMERPIMRKKCKFLENLSKVYQKKTINFLKAQVE